MDMIALFFKQGNDIIVTARYPDISSGTGMSAKFFFKDDKTTSDTDPSVKVYTSTVIADPDNIVSTMSKFTIPRADTGVPGAYWWKVNLTDAPGSIRTASQGPLLVEAV